MREALGRPLAEALEGLPDPAAIRVEETAAPLRNGQARQAGTPRVIACRAGVWSTARFLDGAPRKKEEA